MATYFWGAETSDNEPITTGDWDDPNNWSEDTVPPSGPPGAGDDANLTYATSISMDGDTVGDISGEDDSTVLTGDFTVTGTLQVVTVGGGDSISIGTCIDCMLDGGTIEIGQLVGATIDGADVTTGALNSTSGFTGLEINSGSLTAGALNLENPTSFVGIEMHGGVPHGALADNWRRPKHEFRLFRGERRG